MENPDLQDKLDSARQRMFMPTSKSDLLKMLNNKVKIISYEDLDNYHNFDDLINEYGSTIMLYPLHDNDQIGHWCCVFRMPNTDTIQYFDSYGLYLDNAVTDYNDQERKLIHEPRQLEPKLLELLTESPYKDNVYWNEVPFQSSDVATTTCGLWCVARILDNMLTEKEFREKYYDAPLKQEIIPDLLVSAVINNLYGMP